MRPAILKVQGCLSLDFWQNTKRRDQQQCTFFAARYKEVPLQDANKVKHQRESLFSLISDQIEQKPALVNNIWLGMKRASI